MLIRDLMTTNVIVISPNATIKDAAYLMSRNNVGCLLVVEDRKVKGILTERDMLKRALATDMHLENLRIMDIMTKGILTVEEDKDIDYAIDLMTKRNIKKLPVLSEGKLAGIITASDIFKAKYEKVGAVSGLGKMLFKGR
ncbi:MAG: CBS domain-containing protein [Candidatus Hydrothermarchaeales archaeon]